MVNILRSVHRMHLPSMVGYLGFACILWSLSTAAQAQPLRVFILAGQSNMQGHAHIRTFEHLRMNEADKALLHLMEQSDGTPRVCDRVWISSIGCAEAEQTGKLTIGFGAGQNGPKIGPEYTFGLTMERALDGPILLIKTSWGGKSLNTDFRSPSAGPYPFSESQIAQWEKQGKDLSLIKLEKQQATGVYYRMMIDHVQSVLNDLDRVVPRDIASSGYELSGFVWLQGWNDMVDASTYPLRDQSGGYEAYTEAMIHLIRDVRTELHAPKLPIVIGVLGVGGPVDDYGPDQQRYRGIHQNFRLAMAAPANLPEFQGNVAALWTEKYWDKELSDAKAKEDRLRQQGKQQAKAEQLTPDAERRLVERLLQEGLTDRERELIAKGISNFEFHYLGSAKILGGIGNGLAETMLDLLRDNGNGR